MRMATTLAALRRCGEVELFVAVSDTRADFADPPPELGLARTERLAIDDRPPGPADYARFLVRPSDPFEMALRARAGVTDALGRFVSGRYDLVWFFQAHAWVLSGAPPLAPSVVDLVDAENQKIETRARLRARTAASGPLRTLARRAWTAEDLRRWRALHRRLARDNAAVVVCSELDAGRSGIAGIRVVDNDYPAPHPPVGRAEVSSPPVVVFQGTLRYPPNADAVRFLLDDIGPRLRALVPGVQIRLVGVASPAQEARADPPTVTLTGRVPDMTAELARADLVVIPLRYASGTRIKILEAFAHRIPVVSTTVGAEGLDVRPGEHLLVADDPEGLARACARLLEDGDLRRTIVDRAQALFLDRYQSSRVEDAVVSLATELGRR
jgi:hypothetical protein